MLAAYSAWHGAPTEMDQDVAAAVAGAETAAALYMEPTRAAEMMIIPTRHGADRHPDAVAYGREVSKKVLALVANSGYEKSAMSWSEVAGTTAYPWKPTGRGEPGLEPGWGAVTPIVRTTSTCTLPAPTNEQVLTESEQMFADFNRTAAVGDDVMWWLAGTGTATPSGQWLRMAVAALQTANTDPETALKVLTTAAVASADVGIAGWEEKYKHNVARPETVWKATSGDAAPTLPRETPNHPSYPSGHSLFGNAVASVLVAALGDVAMTDQLPADLYVPAQTRTWPTITAALKEAGQSRVNAGFHFPMDILAGEQLGKCVAEKVSNSLDQLSRTLR